MEILRPGKVVSEHMVLGSAFCILAIMIVGAMVYLLRPKSPQESTYPYPGNQAGAMEESSSGRDIADSAGQEAKPSELNARVRGTNDTGE